jgi:hypothetical protein
MFQLRSGHSALVRNVPHTKLKMKILGLDAHCFSMFCEPTRTVNESFNKVIGQV